MYKLDRKFIHTLFSDYARSLVGRLCKQNELLLEDSTITKEQAVNLLKNYNKELIYEGFRDLENQIKAYQYGQEYIKFNIYNPNSKKE